MDGILGEYGGLIVEITSATAIIFFINILFSPAFVTAAENLINSLI